jgi:hypothetical protein
MRAKRVQYHQQGRTRHGGGRHQRRRQAGNRQRHGQQIVARGQPQILPHQPQRLSGEADGRDDGREAVAEENQIGGGLAQMRRGHRRHRDVRGRQRRRVVHAVADHHDLETRRFSSSMRAILSAGVTPARHS